MEEWNDGENSGYGSGAWIGVENCAKECSKHIECKAFILQKRSRRCGFWKGGKLELKLLSGHHCYVKQGNVHKYLHFVISLYVRTKYPVFCFVLLHFYFC